MNLDEHWMALAEVDVNDWMGMDNEHRRELLDDEFDVTKDWSDLKPITKYELKKLEADVYKELQG